MNDQIIILEEKDRHQRILAMLRRVQGDQDYEMLKSWRHYGRLMKHGKTSNIRRHAKGQRLLIAHLYMPSLRRILPKWRAWERRKKQLLEAQRRY